jgi:membrane-associated protease RseP (regulator of RpoE activity)
MSFPSDGNPAASDGNPTERPLPPLSNEAERAFRPSRQTVLPALLFMLTLATTTIAGADMMYLFRRDLPFTLDFDRYGMLLQSPSLLLEGFIFSIPLLLILFAHEMGHFLACEYYQVDATYPYFIPFPTPIGTMGAFIRIRAPIYTRKALFDIAIAGPIAGFLVLLPILLIGVTLSKVHTNLANDSDMVFGNPELIRLLTSFLFPGINTEDIYLHPSARAAWVGLLATALNLLPIGQLDGGHLIYAFTGEFSKLLYRLAWFGVLCLAAFFSWRTWLVWAVLLLFLGMRHPAIYDSEPLGPKRVILAFCALAIFLLSFSAIPVTLH